MAASLAGGIKRDVFNARARRYPTVPRRRAGAQSHSGPGVPQRDPGIRDNLGTWHRYWRVRRRALGVETLKPYDTGPCSPPPIAVPYEQSVEWIAEGVSPLGEEYVEVLRRGALEERWVDVYPNRGKRMGAFSIGLSRTPFPSSS